MHVHSAFLLETSMTLHTLKHLKLRIKQKFIVSSSLFPGTLLFYILTQYIKITEHMHTVYNENRRIHTRQNWYTEKPVRNAGSLP